MCALLMTGLVLFESVVPPWAPYFIIYALLALILPVFLGAYNFGQFADVIKQWWKLILAVFFIALVWDQGICTFLQDKLLGLAGKAQDPFYSLSAALVMLSEKAGIKFGISAEAAMLLYAAFVLLWAPVAEELFYRGYVQGALRKDLGLMPAVLMSAAFFAVRHMTHFVFLTPDIPWFASAGWAVSTFGFGLLMSYLYEKTQSLWPPVLIHFAVNIFGVMFSL